MLTGDSEDVARWVDSELGIDEYFARPGRCRLVLPAWVGGVLMSASTIVVAINAQTLRGLRL